MSMKVFHSQRVRKIQYAETSTPMHTVADVYDEFLVRGKRLPDPAVVEKWHDLLVRYTLDDANKIFVVRKYSGGKDNGVWNNRRGSVVRFADGFEIVYADNFLAHEIHLMAYHGVTPTDDAEFKRLIDDRELPITSGTAVEKQIRLYPPASKICGCYLAHIADVNGLYLRDDGSYRELSAAEAAHMYPLGTPGDWTSSPDKIYHVPYSLSDEEKSLVKAHFLRFLDPMNHYVTPETKHCKHSLSGWPNKKNIGEYPYLTYYVQTQRHAFGSRYIKFADIGRFKDMPPAGYTGHEVIDLEISFSPVTAVPAPSKPATSTSPKASTPSTKYTYDEKLGVAAFYLKHDAGLIAVEERHLSHFGKRGFEAMTILNSLGIDTSRNSKHKGLLVRSTIDDEIAKATGTFKTTLEEIKNRGLC